MDSRLAGVKNEMVNLQKFSCILVKGLVSTLGSTISILIKPFKSYLHGVMLANKCKRLLFIVISPSRTNVIMLT